MESQALFHLASVSALPVLAVLAYIRFVVLA